MAWHTLAVPRRVGQEMLISRNDESVVAYQVWSAPLGPTTLE